MALNESKQDFEKTKKKRLMLHELSGSSGSGGALGFELNVQRLRTLPTTVERVGRVRKGLRCFFESQTRSRMGTGGPDGPCSVPGPPQTRDLIAHPL